MKKFLILILLSLFSAIAFAQENQAKLEKAEALAIAKAVSLNDDKKALELLLSYAKGKEVSAAFLYNIALLHSNLSNLEDAVNAYSKAISKLDSFYLAHKNIAFCYANLGEHKLALKHIANAAALEGLDLQMYMCIASANLSLNNFGEALFALKNAQMLSPKEESVNNNILFCLSKLELWQELKVASEGILAEDKKSIKAWRSLFLALLNLDEKKELVSAIRAMQLLEISENKDLELLANTYFNQGLFEEAAALYKALGASIEAEKLARVANVLVDIYALDEAIGLAPNNALGNFAKARAYRAKADEKSLLIAENFAQESLSQAPLEPKTLLLLAQLQVDNGNFTRAKLNLNSLKKYAEYSYEAKYLLSYIAIKEEDYALALSLLKQIRNSKNFDYIDSFIKKIEKFLDT